MILPPDYNVKAYSKNRNENNRHKCHCIQRFTVYYIIFHVIVAICTTLSNLYLLLDSSFEAISTVARLSFLFLQFAKPYLFISSLHLEMPSLDTIVVMKDGNSNFLLVTMVFWLCLLNWIYFKAKIYSNKCLLAVIFVTKYNLNECFRWELLSQLERGQRVHSILSSHIVSLFIFYLHIYHILGSVDREEKT